MSYPNIEDAERGLQQGINNRKQYNAIVKAIQSVDTSLLETALGEYVEIHIFRFNTDMSSRCITVLHQDMDSMRNLVDVGTKVIITK